MAAPGGRLCCQLPTALGALFSAVIVPHPAMLLGFAGYGLGIPGRIVIHPFGVLVVILLGYGLMGYG